MQAEKIVVLVAGTPQISRSALERGWDVGERSHGGFNEATNVAMSASNPAPTLTITNVAMSAVTLTIAFARVVANAPNINTVLHHKLFSFGSNFQHLGSCNFL